MVLLKGKARKVLPDSSKKATSKPLRLRQTLAKMSYVGHIKGIDREEVGDKIKHTLDTEAAPLSRLADTQATAVATSWSEPYKEAQ